MSKETGIIKSEIQMRISLLHAPKLPSPYRLNELSYYSDNWIGNSWRSNYILKIKEFRMDRLYNIYSGRINYCFVKLAASD